jgi:hypothetical protein
MVGSCILPLQTTSGHLKTVESAYKKGKQFPTVRATIEFEDLRHNANQKARTGAADPVYRGD